MSSNAEFFELMTERLRLAFQNPEFIDLIAFLIAFYVVASFILSFSHLFISVSFWLLEKARFYFWFRRVFSALPKIDPIDYEYFADLIGIEYSSLKEHFKK